jgi:hypothetical protein
MKDNHALGGIQRPSDQGLRAATGTYDMSFCKCVCLGSIKDSELKGSNTYEIRLNDITEVNSSWGGHGGSFKQGDSSQFGNLRGRLSGR